MALILSRNFVIVCIMSRGLSRKPATVQDVAREANVSTATVSRTLSAPESVSEKKRQAVLEAIAATGYSVNRAARSLRTQRSNMVLALLPTLGNPFFSVVLQGIVDVLTPAGQALVVAETPQLHSAGEDLLSYFNAQRADGMIVLDGGVPQESLSRLRDSENGSRIVFACEWTPMGGFPSVRSDNEQGARLAVQHLLALGHSDIIHVTGPKGNVLTQARIDGYASMCQSHSLLPRYIEGGFSLDAGLRAAQTLLDMPKRPSAVFCASDMIAFGLVSGLTQAGISVPEDVSIVGFDDIEYAAHFVPPLTTIRQDRAALGQTAAQVLLQGERSLSGRATADTAPIPVSLIERSSTSVAKT